MENVCYDETASNDSFTCFDIYYHYISKIYGHRVAYDHIFLY